MIPHRTALFVLTLAMALSACGGGSSAPPGPPPAPSSDIIAHAHVASGVPLRVASGRRSVRAAATIATVTVKGAVTPSYAGTVPVSNQQTVKPNADGTFDVNLPFSGLTTGNNAYLVLDLQATATDGSQFSLGQLAALVDVTTTKGQVVEVSAQSTQRFQVYGALLLAQIISTVEARQPDLDVTLQTRIAATGVNPDPTTNLFTPAQLQSLVAALAPAFDRAIKITSDPRTAAVTLAWDWSNTDEENLSASTRIFKSFLIADPTRSFPASGYLAQRAGGPCSASFGSAAATSSVRRTAAAASTSDVCLQAFTFPNGSGGVTISHVYGGAVIAGATSAQPFVSGTLHVASTPAGGITTDNVAVTSSEVDAPIFDTFLAWFPNAVPTQPGHSYGVYNFVSGAPFASSSYATFAVPEFGNIATAGSIGTLPINTFSPLGLPSSAVLFCVLDTDNLVNNVPDGFSTRPCPAVSSLGSARFTVPRVFHDHGSDPTVYGWVLAGGVTSMTENTGGGSGHYDVEMNGQTGSITTQAPGLLMRSVGSAPPTLEIIFVQGAPPQGTTITVTATASSGTQYTGMATITPTQAAQAFSVIGIAIGGNPPSYVPLSQLSISFALPNGTTHASFNIGAMLFTPT
jgi:hypothetical protein